MAGLPERRTGADVTGAAGVGVFGGLRETPGCWLRRMTDDMSAADHGCMLRKKVGVSNFRKVRDALRLGERVPFKNVVQWRQN